jgi:two-component system OmpR family sensor kinase
MAIDAVNDARVAGPDHRWELDLPEEPLLVSGDEHALHQVLANLLANARTHTPGGTTVTVEMIDSDAVAEMHVRDDGPGIAPELVPHIFERFIRGDAARSRATDNTGLGLSIAAAIIEAHAGSIEVESRPGRTDFIVRIASTPAAARATGTPIPPVAHR